MADYNRSKEKVPEGKATRQVELRVLCSSHVASMASVENTACGDPTGIFNIGLVEAFHHGFRTKRIKGLGLFEVPGGKLVSMVVCDMAEGSRESIHVMTVATLPFAQREGHATRLLKELRKCEPRKAISLEIQPEVSRLGMPNSNLRAWYEKLGFVATGHERQDAYGHRCVRMVWKPSA